MKSSLALEYAFPGCDASAELSYSTLSCHRISKFSVSGRKLGMSLLWLCFIPGIFADKCVSTEEQKKFSYVYVPEHMWHYVLLPCGQTDTFAFVGHHFP